MLHSLYLTFLGNICGNKCLTFSKFDHKIYCWAFNLEWNSTKCQSLDSEFSGSTKAYCKCGSHQYTLTDFYKKNIYCCSPNDSCQQSNSTIICQKGTILDTDQKCGDECPTSKVVSTMALASMDACTEDNHQDTKCYVNKASNFNKICPNQSEAGNFGKMYCGSNNGSVNCKNEVIFSKNEIRQCFNYEFIG